MLVASVENNLNHFLSILEFTFHSFHYSFSIFSRRWCCLHHVIIMLKFGWNVLQKSSANLDSSGEGDTEYWIGCAQWFRSTQLVLASNFKCIHWALSLSHERFFLKADCLGTSALFRCWANMQACSWKSHILEVLYKPTVNNSKTLAAAASSKLTEVVEKSVSVLSSWFVSHVHLNVFG